MNGDLVLGVDIGGTKMAAVVARPSGEVLTQVTVPTPLDSDQATVNGILQTIAAVIEAGRVSPGAVAAIGIGAPGRVLPEEGAWLGSTNVPLRSPPVPLVALVEQRFGRPAFVDNDVKAGALGEHRFGASRGLQHTVYLSVGTGIAAGIIIDGRLYRGVRAAGEIGHAPVERNGPRCGCGNYGCLEMLASGASIARRGRRALQAGRDTLIAALADGHPEAVTGKVVVEAAARGDAVALEIMEETASYLAMGVLIAFRAYDPQRLVIAGGVSRAGEILLDPLRRALDRQTGGRSATYVERLSLSELGDRAGVLGAVAVALQHLRPS
jgi:glucokinase